MFYHQMEALKKRFHVVLVDLRGHGRSQMPSCSNRISRLARDLDELITHMKLKQVDLLGWSMGVSVIWAYLDLFGENKVRKLIFVDQPAMLTKLPDMSDVEFENSGALFDFEDIKDLYKELLGENGEAVRAGFVNGMLSKNCPQNLKDWVIDQNKLTPLSVAAALLLTHCSNDWRAVLPFIRKPVLIFCGAASHVNPKSQHYIHRQIKGSSIVEFSADEAGGHFMFLENPTKFNDELMKFLRG